MDNHYYTFILASKRSGALFIGSTGNLAEHVLLHKRHRLGGITSQYNINQLVYYEGHPDFEAARARAESIKGLHRQWKLELIDAFNPDWRDLYPEVAK